MDANVCAFDCSNSLWHLRVSAHVQVCVRQHLNELKKKVARGRNLRVFWVNCHDVCPLTIDSCDAVYTFISIFLCFFTGIKAIRIICHCKQWKARGWRAKGARTKVKRSCMKQRRDELWLRNEDAIQILQLTLFAHALRFLDQTYKCDSRYSILRCMRCATEFYEKKGQNSRVLVRIYGNVPCNQNTRKFIWWWIIVSDAC